MPSEFCGKLALIGVLGSSIAGCMSSASIKQEISTVSKGDLIHTAKCEVYVALAKFSADPALFQPATDAGFAKSKQRASLTVNLKTKDAIKGEADVSLKAPFEGNDSTLLGGGGSRTKTIETDTELTVEFDLSDPYLCKGNSNFLKIIPGNLGIGDQILKTIEELIHLDEAPKEFKHSVTGTINYTITGSPSLLINGIPGNIFKLGGGISKENQNKFVILFASTPTRDEKGKLIPKTEVEQTLQNIRTRSLINISR